jgi:hypothetical protein
VEAYAWLAIRQTLDALMFMDHYSRALMGPRLMPAGR